MHVVSKSDFPPEEQDTTQFGNRKNVVRLLRRVGSITTTEEATVHVRGLDMFLTVR